MESVDMNASSVNTLRRTIESGDELVSRRKREFANPEFNFDDLSEVEKEELCFEVLVEQELFKGFMGALSSVGFDDKQVIEFINRIGSYPTDESVRILAIPHELQERRLSSYLDEVKSGKMSISDIVDDIYQTNAEMGFTLAYHTSPHLLKPDTEGRWDIKGTEKDHRDDDKLRAYYSLDLENLYTKKDFKHLYFVRGVDAEGQGHYKDGDGRWGRASSLSVIGKVDWDRGEIQDKVDDMVAEFKREIAELSKDENSAKDAA